MQAVNKEMKATRAALMELHRLLLASLKRDRERASGHLMNATEWFQALISGPEYSWLKPLNSLIADADALAEHAQISAQDLAILRHELERFFFKDDDDITSFNSHYRKLFAQNHELILSHGDLKRAVAELPNIAPPLNAEEIRRSWHKIGASKRKLLN